MCVYVLVKKSKAQKVREEEETGLTSTHSELLQSDIDTCPYIHSPHSHRLSCPSFD